MLNVHSAVNIVSDEAAPRSEVSANLRELTPRCRARSSLRLPLSSRPATLAHVQASAVPGIDACAVHVVADVSNGLPMMSVVGPPDAAVNEITAEGLQCAAKSAEDAGVTLVLELLNSKVDHHDYQCDRTAWGVAVCEAVNSPRVKLLYDIYHMQIMEGDIIPTIRQNVAHIGHFHTAGNPCRTELDESQELYYPPIMQAIAALHYDGYVAQEFGPRKSEDWSMSVEAAYRVCGV
jgi:hydroxypyruvate isomerase